MKKYIYFILFVLAFSANAIQAQSKDSVYLSYEKIDRLDNGMFQLEKDSQQALIDAQGKLLVPFGKYDQFCDFRFINGYAYVYRTKPDKKVNHTSNITIVPEKNKNYGIIDESGREIIPLKYDRVGYVSDGCAFVLKKNLNGGRAKWGLVNRQGKLISGFLYDDDNNAPYFRDGRAIVIKDGYYGAIDTTGMVVIPFQYDYLSHTNGLILGDKDRKFFIFDKKKS